MPQFTAEELKTKTLEELAILGERNHPLSAEGILINNELQRRSISTSEIKEKWYDKPSGMILIGVVASLLAGLLLYFYTLLLP